VGYPLIVTNPSWPGTGLAKGRSRGSWRGGASRGGLDGAGVGEGRSASREREGGARRGAGSGAGASGFGIFFVAFGKRFRIGLGVGGRLELELLPVARHAHLLVIAVDRRVRIFIARTVYIFAVFGRVSSVPGIDRREWEGRGNERERGGLPLVLAA